MSDTFIFKDDAVAINGVPIFGILRANKLYKNSED